MFKPSAFPSLPDEVRNWLQELSRLPYENLSKIVVFHRSGTGAEMQRWDGDKGFQETGTCFGQTWYLWKRMRKAGYACELLLGDKGAQKGVHCALLWHYQNRDYLLDPGYLIFEPMELTSLITSPLFFSPPNQIRIEDSGSCWKMYSGPIFESPLKLKHRFDFGKTPVGEEDFRTAWKKSFDLDMMHYPVLTRVEKGIQYYLQKRNLVIRSTQGSESQRLTRENMPSKVQELFGLPETLTQAALEIVTSRYRDFFR